MMKLLNKKQKSNGGFSLVELIVVIAIMVVLVAVLAPVFTRYIESSRKSSDVQNAAQIRTSVETEAVEAESQGGAFTPASGDATKTNIKTLNDDMEIKSDVLKDKGKAFKYEYSGGKCIVYSPSDSDKHDLASDDGAQWYKNDAGA